MANTGQYEDEKETGRLEAFSDGVFSIAIRAVEPSGRAATAMAHLRGVRAELRDGADHVDQSPQTVPAHQAQQSYIPDDQRGAADVGHAGSVSYRNVGVITRQYRFGPLLYFVAFVLAFVYVPASIGLCALLAAFFALPEKWH